MNVWIWHALDCARSSGSRHALARLRDKLWHALPGCTIVHLVASGIRPRGSKSRIFLCLLSAREMRRKCCNAKGNNENEMHGEEREKRQLFDLI